MVEEKSDYIYHYTTIETLALILKNRTIRFNSLANVDDLDEQESYDLKDFGKFCYASCWSLDNKENIALWNMYSKNGLGVRIGMPKRWYAMKEFTIPQQDGRNPSFSNYFGALTINNDKNQAIFNINPIGELNEMPVIYTDREEYLKPSIYEAKNNEYSIKWAMLGNVKSEIWSFQKEYRFSFCTIPNAVFLLGMQGKTVEEIGHFCKLANPPFQYYDIGIDSEAFDKMEILIGPSASESEKIIIESLVSTYNSSASIKYSALKVKLK